MTFKFNDQLKQGHKGEILFMEVFPFELERTDGRGADFIIKLTNQTLELKTDSYDPLKTSNYFMERYSSKEKQSPGGPFQAESKGIEYYAYMFSKTKEYTVFRTKELVKYLNENMDEKKLIGVPNKTYITQGYKVDRASVAHLVVDVNKEFKNEI